jgi:hypothetical protein
MLRHHSRTLIIVFVLTAGCSSPPQKALSPDEKAIQDSATAWQEAANRHDFPAWASYTCESQLKLSTATEN